MKPTNDLFDLIRSLTRNEKGYFKKFSSLHVQKGQNNYMKLFDAIDEQKKYDEEKIKKHFSGSTFIKHLPSEKNYLHDLIVSSLCRYHTGKNVDFTLRDLLNQLNILYDKGLHAACDKVLKKAKQLAAENEKFLFLSEIVGWEKKIIAAKGIYHKAEDLENIYNEAIGALELEKNSLEYLKIHNIFFYHVRKHEAVRNKEEYVLFKKFIEHPLIKNENSALTVPAKLRLYNMLGAYYYITVDFETSCHYYKKLIAVYDSIPAKRRDVNLYAEYMMNYTTACAYSKRYSECEKNIRVIKNLQANSHQDTIRIYYIAVLQETMLELLTGNFDKAQSIMEQIQPNIEKDKPLINPVVYEVITTNYSFILFGLGRYKEALQELHKLLYNKDTMFHFREDIQSSSLLLYLLVHIELGNRELIEHAVKSTFRHLRKKKRLYKFETAILNFIKNKLSKIHTEQDLKKAFIVLRDEMVEIAKDPYEKLAFMNFDIIPWLESKIENRPFAEIVRKKTKGRAFSMR